jgi:hypothetical protein
MHVYYFTISVSHKFRTSHKTADKVSARALVSNETSTEQVYTIKFTHLITIILTAHS